MDEDEAKPQDGQARKLAAILASDIVGYSAHAEADEASAIDLVRQVRARMDAAAATYGGRVFNTAGDGFMLEFPTASGAFDAAASLAAQAGPPLRIGVHLGEVAEAAGGDLLGHGVNVAARLQAQAAPNAPLFSADAQRALRGERAARLKRQGVIALAKMNERIEVFRLVGGARSAPRRGLPLRPWAVAGVVVAALAALGAGAWLWMGGQRPPPLSPRLAIGAIDAPDAPTGSFSRGLQDEIRTQLLANDADVLAADALAGVGKADAPRLAAERGAGLLLSGAIRPDGQALHVSVQLDATGSRQTLWSYTDDEPADWNAARQRIATAVTNAVRCASRQGAPGLPFDVLKNYVAACANLRVLDRPELARTRRLFKDVQAQAPSFARAYAGLALADSFYALRLPPAEAESVRQEGRASAQRALALDPHDGMAWTALSRMLPRHAFAERDAVLRKGLAAAPDDASVHATMGDLLAETGRNAEAVLEREKAHDLDPIEPFYAIGLVYAWHLEGRQAQADALSAETLQRWPSFPGPWQAALRSRIWKGQVAEARRVADQLGSGAPRMPPEEVAAWKTLTASLGGPGAPGAAGARAALKRLADERGPVQADAIYALAQIGALDDAFAAASVRARNPTPSTVALFDPPAAPMWRDRRFMGLAAELGLAQYWLGSGTWPDLCRDPALPYDCRAEAQRAVAAMRP